MCQNWGLVGRERERYIFKSSIEIQIYMCQLIQSKTWRWRHDQYWSSSFATLKSVFHLESILLAATLPSILFFIDLCNYWGKEPPQPKIWYIFLVGFLIKKWKLNDGFQMFPWLPWGWVKPGKSGEWDWCR